MFNSLAQYFLGTSNANNLDPGSKTNHQEVPTNNSVDSHHQQQQVEQVLAQQNVFQVYPNKRGRARRNRKNKVTSGGAGGVPSQKVRGSSSAVEDSPVTCASPDFLQLQGIRVCEEDDEWLFVECTQAKANKKGGIITLHDDLDITCLPEDEDVLEPPKPRFEIKHNPLNLNQQQLKRQLRQQNAALISCEDIEDDEELMRSAPAEGREQQRPDEIQVIDPEQPAVVEGDSVDVEVPPVAIELPTVVEQVQQQQQQAHGDEEPKQPRKTMAQVVAEGLGEQQQPQKRGMEESWFVTPPSCFTSQGPVHMETSPLENLLIEHPSMSVYSVRSIERSAADIEESLVVLEREETPEDVKMDQTVSSASPAMDRTLVHTDEVADDSDSDDEQLESTNRPVRSERPFDYVCNREAKQGLLFRNAQMNHDKKIRQKLCRNAMTRSNKTCEMNATKNGPKKRSEKQHAKSASRANNNRKC